MKETNSSLPKKMIGLLIVFFTLFCSSGLYAQSVISGTVADNAGKPVTGATVTVKGKSVATKTGDNGNFSITASPDDVLIITSVGFAKQEVSLNGKTSISIVMDAAASDLGEVVVIGYGTQR